ncbi:hypothetical protein H4Q26_009556 [Puccinia striiformis f. sp. tritici PST-130]|nr:hypothetical protein H4Q26_009556 [Puccinia striiformis f. sp. tritici PST-130]
MFAYNKYKQYLINSKIPDGTSTTVYRSAPMIDLCVGPNIPNTGQIKAFSVLKNSASYFLGDSGNDSLQRIYGISFPDKKAMVEYKKFLEEAAKRDHRKIGKDQDLFFFHELSPGGCFWLPHGTRIYNTLVEFFKVSIKSPIHLNHHFWVSHILTQDVQGKTRFQPYVYKLLLESLLPIKYLDFSPFVFQILSQMLKLRTNHSEPLSDHYNDLLPPLLTQLATSFGYMRFSFVGVDTSDQFNIELSIMDGFGSFRQLSLNELEAVVDEIEKEKEVGQQRLRDCRAATAASQAAMGK